DNLGAMSKGLSDVGRMGEQWDGFYHKATFPGGRKYGQFAGADKSFTPYGFEVTNDGNVNIKAVDFSQLTNNYLGVRDRNLNYGGKPIKLRDIWSTPNDFAQDAHTMFSDHADGRSGAATIGMMKRDLIHGLSQLGTAVSKESNPFASGVPAKARSIIKSYRIDRMSQLNPTGTMRPFKSEAQYYQYLNRNYIPESAPEKIQAAAIKIGDRTFTGSTHAEAQGKADDAGETGLINTT